MWGRRAAHPAHLPRAHASRLRSTACCQKAGLRSTEKRSSRAFSIATRCIGSSAQPLSRPTSVFILRRFQLTCSLMAVGSSFEPLTCNESERTVVVTMEHTRAHTSAKERSFLACAACGATMPPEDDDE